ncbi:hypothetical protein Ait01nite_008890 [Actinoplanes italicus]|uniref:Uncharacterized protein n=1 Tax=Actinoplanes italicus TaxID=113567 RepID=A0A2T0KLC5_9ACTN|nr:hypothetical protein [Actinoplanes italicus]PRX24429.1 hypothetical protein CLV67_102204 [Actinoplanes italicus]GIE27844.1 hypothetical protein Ait01nite_008890 [Actinoplanes italicus]
MSGVAQEAAAALLPLLPEDEDEDELVLLLDEEDDEDVELEDDVDVVEVSGFLAAASPEPLALPLADFSALTFPERESLR